MAGTASVRAMRNFLLPILLVLSAPAAAQQDPSAQDTLIEFGGPETLSVETAEAVHQFTVDIAATPDQMERGLMWRDTLAADAGMLFIYDPVRPASMWMRNTLVSLDILYLDEDGEVLKLIAHAQPGSLRSLGSSFPVAGVLELAGGRALELGIRPGAVVRHAAFDNLVEESDGEDAAPAADDASEAAPADDESASDAESPTE